MNQQDSLFLVRLILIALHDITCNNTHENTKQLRIASGDHDKTTDINNQRGSRRQDEIVNIFEAPRTNRAANRREPGKFRPRFNLSVKRANNRCDKHLCGPDSVLDLLLGSVGSISRPASPQWSTYSLLCYHLSTQATVYIFDYRHVHRTCFQTQHNSH